MTETVLQALTRRNQVLMNENQDLREQVAQLQQGTNEQTITIEGLNRETEDLREENNDAMQVIHNIHNNILELVNRETSPRRSIVNQIEENLEIARRQRDQFVRSIEQTHGTLMTHLNRNDLEGNPIEQTEILLEELINQHDNLRGENQQLIRDIERAEGIPGPAEENSDDENENPFEEPEENLEDVDFGELQGQHNTIVGRITRTNNLLLQGLYNIIGNYEDQLRDWEQITINTTQFLQQNLDQEQEGIDEYNTERAIERGEIPDIFRIQL
jgi:hypothetical protein